MSTKRKKNKSSKNKQGRMRAFTEDRELDFPKDPVKANMEAHANAERSAGAKNGTGRAENGQFASAKRPVATRNAKGELSTDGKNHKGITNGFSSKGFKKDGYPTVRQAVGNKRGGKIDREGARENSEKSFMHKGTAKALLRRGIITEDEYKSMIGTPQQVRAAWRDKRRAMGKATG